VFICSYTYSVYLQLHAQCLSAATCTVFICSYMHSVYLQLHVQCLSAATRTVFICSYMHSVYLQLHAQCLSAAIPASNAHTRPRHPLTSRCISHPSTWPMRSQTSSYLPSWRRECGDVCHVALCLGKWELSPIFRVLVYSFTTRVLVVKEINRWLIFIFI